MAVALHASRRTIEELGRDGVADLAAHLWPGKCQTCGHPLGTLPPALVVHDTNVAAGASLHHTGCQVPIWNDKGGIPVAAGAAVTSTSCMLCIDPFPTAPPADAPTGEPGLRPVMLWSTHAWSRCR